MLEQTGNAITFFAFFSANKTGKTGLTVTVNVRRGVTSVVTGDSATELADGLYYYTLASGDVNAEALYTAVFKTADSSVDQQDIPALWIIGKAGVEHLDADVSSRLAASSYSAAPTAADIREEIDDNSVTLAAIKGKTDLISLDNVTFTAPTDPITGDLTIVRGDDYTAASGRPLPTWDSDDWTPFSLSTALSVTFKARTPYSETVFEQAATVLSATSVQVELSSAQTSALAAGHESYRFDLEAILSGGEIITLAQGKLTVLEDVR